MLSDITLIESIASRSDAIGSPLFKACVAGLSETVESGAPFCLSADLQIEGNTVNFDPTCYAWHREKGLTRFEALGYQAPELSRVLAVEALSFLSFQRLIDLGKHRLKEMVQDAWSEYYHFGICHSGAFLLAGDAMRVVPSRGTDAAFHAILARTLHNHQALSAIHGLQACVQGVLRHQGQAKTPRRDFEVRIRLA